MCAAQKSLLHVFRDLGTKGLVAFWDNVYLLLHWKILRVALVMVRAGVSSQGDTEQHLAPLRPAREAAACRPPFLTWVVAVPATFRQVWCGGPRLCGQLEEWAGFLGCHQSH